uniref:Vomeronasal type-1 receptor n=1 Tax=Romanomermis culicivorax TaxID=13658 RepID=A0A915KIX1_ROMCU
MGKWLLMLTVSQSYISFVVIGFYNLRTVLFLRNVRKSLTMVDGTSLCKQEVKLFLQALITGTCYMGVKATYLALNIFMPHDKQVSIWCYVWLDFIWLMNSCISPLVYYMLNRTLRQHFHAILKCSNRP